MSLPARLHDLAELAAEGVPLAQLTRAAETLSGRYRAEVQDGAWHVSGDLAARSYLLTRFPATFAAVSRAMQEVAAVRPDFAPRTQLDVGAGPATAFWAAQGIWESLADALMLEGSPHMRDWGEKLSARADAQANWQTVDVRRGLPDLPPRDLVTLAYVLNELAPDARAGLLLEMWERTADTLLIVEPGTPAGWNRMLQARNVLLAAGANLLAPCPHAQTCPLHAPDWCHFSQRVARSRLHRQGKGAELGYEDEKFIYLAVSRRAGEPFEARVLTSPSMRSGLVNLKLCTAAGHLEGRTLSKRDGEAYKVAKRLDWGDKLD